MKLHCIIVYWSQQTNHMRGNLIVYKYGNDENKTTAQQTYIAQVIVTHNLLCLIILLFKKASCVAWLHTQEEFWYTYVIYYVHVQQNNLGKQIWGGVHRNTSCRCKTLHVFELHMFEISKGHYYWYSWQCSIFKSSRRPCKHSTSGGKLEKLLCH